MVAYSFKEQFVVPIAIGLGLELNPDKLPWLHGFSIAAGIEIKPKRQTIRAYGKRRHAREGETLQLYRGMRTRQCFKIGEATCTEIHRIIIWPDVMAVMVNGVLMTARQLMKFARADGFANVKDMQAFWLEEHGTDKFQGVLIRWLPLAQTKPSV